MVFILDFILSWKIVVVVPLDFEFASMDQILVDVLIQYFDLLAKKRVFLPTAAF